MTANKKPTSSTVLGGILSLVILTVFGILGSAWLSFVWKVGTSITDGIYNLF